MDEKQLQFLYNEYAKNKGFKDYSEFKGLMSSEGSRKLFFDDANKELGFKDYSEFNDLLGLKKKASGEISSLTELPSEFIEPLKRGISPNQTKEEARAAKELGVKPMTGVIVPTNLPKQDEMRYERELKTQDAAINTLTDIYKQKGLKFDPSKPAAQEQIQDYIEQERSNDLARVTGKDGKEYLTRGQGFIEAGAKALVNSVIEPFKSAEINFTNTPSELADLLDKKIAEEPNVPESAPTKVGGYMGGLLGGLPKLMGLLSIPYFGESAMVIEMYHNAIANERRTLYQRGIMSKENGGEGLDREAAAKMAMETAPITAAPDAAMGLVLARGVSGKNIIPDAEKKAFRDALAPFKDVAKVAGLGGVAGSSKSLLALASGYDVTATEVLESGGRSAGEYALMDGAFKLMHKAGTIANVGLRASKAVVSAAKNLLSSVPKEILEVQAEKYPDGKEIIQKVEEFAKVKDEVKDLVPAEKVGAVAGITQKIKNIQVDIDELTARREKTTDALKPQIDEWLKEYQDEIDFYNNQIKKVVKSKDPSGISEEIDDVTGEKIGAKKYIVDGKEVSQGEFEAMQGKPEGTKEIVEPTEIGGLKVIKRVEDAGGEAVYEVEGERFLTADGKELAVAKVEIPKEEVKPTERKASPLKDIENLKGEQSNIRTEESRKIVNAVRRLEGLEPYTGPLDKLYSALKEADDYNASVIFSKLNNLNAAVEAVKNLPSYKGFMAEAKAEATPIVKKEVKPTEVSPEADIEKRREEEFIKRAKEVSKSAKNIIESVENGKSQVFTNVLDAAKDVLSNLQAPIGGNKSYFEYLQKQVNAEFDAELAALKEVKPTEVESEKSDVEKTLYPTMSGSIPLSEALPNGVYKKLSNDLFAYADKGAKIAAIVDKAAAIVDKANGNIVSKSFWNAKDGKWQLPNKANLKDDAKRFGINEDVYIKKYQDAVDILNSEVKPTEVKEEITIEEEPTQSDIAKQQTIETDLLIGGQAAQRRKDNKYTKDGVEYIRNSKGNGVPSSVTGDVRFTNEVSLPFKYKLIEAKDLQPSHQDGIRNPNHFIPEAQPKNRNDAGSLMAENSFSSKPRFEELGENTNAYSGAPIVNERGEVVQGNNRAAGLRKGYDAKNKQYKNDLANNSSQFGFTKEQVEKMNEPILVREVAVSDEGAIEVGNYDVKDLETGGKRRLDPIAITRRMPFDIKGRIAEMLFTGEETLNQAIRANQKRVLELLNPYLNQAQRNTITKEGVLTDAGIKDLEDVVKQFLFDNGDTALPDLFENLSANQKEGLKKSLPYIFSTSPDKSIVPDIQEAILAVADFRDSGAGDFNAWLAQGDMFADGKTPRDKYTPLEIEIAKTLIEAKTQKEIVKKFGDYSDIVKDKEANMFDPAIAGKTRAEGIKEIFKTEDYAKPISERGGKTPVRKEELAAEPSPKPRAEKEKIAGKEAKKGVEEAYKDLTINQKRQIINSKFDEVLKELKIEKICPT